MVDSGIIGIVGVSLLVLIVSDVNLAAGGFVLSPLTFLRDGDPPAADGAFILSPATLTPVFMDPVDTWPGI